jgi:hypothetical protein
MGRSTSAEHERHSYVFVAFLSLSSLVSALRKEAMSPSSASFKAMRASRQAFECFGIMVAGRDMCYCCVDSKVV